MYKYNKNILIFLSFVVLAFISISVLMLNKQLYGISDIIFHAKRVAELSDSIKNGVLLPRYAFNYMHGNAVMTIYPYISVYPLAVIYLLSGNYILSYYIYCFINILLALNISYYSSLSFSKSKRISYLFAVCYGMSAAFISEAFVIYDLGILTSMIGIPMIIFGIYDILENRGFMKLSFGMTIIIFSHTLSTLISIALLIVIALCNYKKSIHRKALIFKATFLTIISTIVYWIPVFTFAIKNFYNIITPDRWVLYGTPIKSLLTSFLGGSSIILNPFSLFGIVIFIIYRKKVKNKYNKQFFYISIFIIIITSDIFPWYYTSHLFNNVLGTFQYLHRLYVIPLLMLTYLFSYLVVIFLKKHRKGKYIYIFLIVLSILIQLSSQLKIIINHSNNSELSIEYLNKTKAPSKAYNRHISLYFLDGHSEDKLIKRPFVTLNKESDIKLIINNRKMSMQKDYYPKFIENNMFDYVNTYNGLYKYSPYNDYAKKIGFYKDGYDKFKFKINKESKHIVLPFVIYNNESLDVYLDNKRTYYNDYKGIIMLKDVSQGNHKVQFKEKQSSLFNIIYFLSIIFTLIIYLQSFYKFCFKDNK